MVLGERDNLSSKANRKHGEMKPSTPHRIEPFLEGLEVSKKKNGKYCSFDDFQVLHGNSVENTGNLYTLLRSKRGRRNVVLNIKEAEVGPVKMLYFDFESRLIRRVH